MLSTRVALLTLLFGFASPLLAPVPGASPALAQEMSSFTPAAFEAAKKAGSSILVEVTAPWCPTCKAQKPILEKLLGEARFAKMKVFNVDFDSQKAALKMLGVSMQSTLITYKAGAEVGRSTGVTEARAIEDQLSKAI